MKKSAMFFAFIAIGMFFFLMSCNDKGNKIDYKTADGYFVLNTVQNDGAYDKKITTQEEFNKYFGMATTMDASPTSIDFNKEFLAAYILPITNVETKVNVDSVVWNGNKTEMWLSIETGDSLTYSLRPVKILLIDKKYDGDVTTYVTSYNKKR